MPVPISYAENTFSVYVLSEHGLLGGVAVLLLYVWVVLVIVLYAWRVARSEHPCGCEPSRCAGANACGGRRHAAGARFGGGGCRRGVAHPDPRLRSRHVRRAFAARAHVELTADAGERGVAVYSAHRDTHFRFLKDVAPGDEIDITRSDGKTFRYRADSSSIVRFDASGIDPLTDGHELVLSTCWPFDALTPGPDRYLLHATLITP